MLKTSQNGLSFIEQHEGKRLAAYRDGGQVLTIGVGHTGPDVYPGMTITHLEAMQLLAKDVVHAEQGVNSAVKVPLTQNQFDALVSLTFNIGVTAFTSSTLLKKLNRGDYAGASAQFERWCRDNGRMVQGLLNRRRNEAALFNKA